MSAIMIWLIADFSWRYAVLPAAHDLVLKRGRTVRSQMRARYCLVFFGCYYDAFIDSDARRRASEQFCRICDLSFRYATRRARRKMHLADRREWNNEASAFFEKCEYYCDVVRRGGCLGRIRNQAVLRPTPPATPLPLGFGMAASPE